MKRFMMPSSVTPCGSIGARASLLYGRLESVWYRPEKVFTSTNAQAGWSGDWEGRTILALTLMYRLTGKHPSYLGEIMDELRRRLNRKGYLGIIYEGGITDEQQLSGHGWLLRGLCEYWDCFRDDTVLGLIRRIMENLFLPASAHFRDYPCERRAHGEAAGVNSGKSGNWLLSTDVGCAFISLDGTSAACELLSRPEAAETADAAFISDCRQYLRDCADGLLRVPALEINMQTHALLTALRGLVRTSELLVEPRYLTAVEERFGLYTEYGMTLNYENTNLLGEPFWTEPCGVIDSFMLASQLFLKTGNIRYCDLAQRILYNGVYRTQIYNGGFTTDICAGGSIPDETLRLNYDRSGKPGEPELLQLGSGGFGEAYWCCTMRGAEGITSASAYSIAEDGDDLLMLYPMPGIYTAGGFTFEVRTAYPEEPDVTIILLRGAPGRCFRLRLAAPGFFSGIEAGPEVSVGRETDYFVITVHEGVRTFSFRLLYELRRENSFGEFNVRDKAMFFRGPLLLGCDYDGKAMSEPKGEVEYLPGGHVRIGDLELAPICNTYLLNEKETSERRFRIYFDRA